MKLGELVLSPTLHLKTSNCPIIDGSIVLLKVGHVLCDFHDIFYLSIRGINEMSIVFKRKIRKWGGSFVCVLPKELLNALQLKLGDELVLSVEQNSIVVKNADLIVNEVHPI